MDFPVRTGTAAGQRTACAILPIFEERLRGATKDADEASAGLIRKLVRSGDASSKLGSTLLVPNTGGNVGRWLLVGCGKAADFDAKKLTKALAAAVGALKDKGIKDAISYLAWERPPSLDAYYAARLTVETVRGALYRFDEWKSNERNDKQRLTRFGLGIADPADAGETRRGAAHGVAIANGMDLARDLGNRPPNVCTPSHLADTAKSLAERHKKLGVEILNERQIDKLGMGALLSVTRGAEEPPRLIVLRYDGGAKTEKPIVLCGKGITFDTGGISLKPPPKMDEMKFDMCGAAGVLGTVAAIAELDLPLNVVGVIPAAENMPSGRATRPGDIVKSLSGKTIEILNTDAEGRLILCDAITYAKRFEPRCLIDVATLTGACVVALGHLHSGLFSNDEALAGALLAASARSLDTAWRLPVDDDYAESLKSNFADFANSGSRDGGASVAAAFLAKFVDGTPWAHLDIAGVAWRTDSNKGATGRPVPLLVDFLLNAGNG
ncbi:MAG TPA: leucyl aminopeptidase [Gammaproteobacteria bacterium]